MKHIALIVCLALAALALGQRNADRQYTVSTITLHGAQNFENELNKFSQKGWIYVDHTETQTPGGKVIYLVFTK